MIKTISQTELNRNFKKYEKDIKKESIIVYKNNKPAFVTMPIDIFEDMVNLEEGIINTAVKRYIELKTGNAKTVKGKDAWKAI